MRADFQEQPLGRVRLAIPRWRMVLGRPTGIGLLLLAVFLLAFAYFRSQTDMDAITLGFAVAGGIAVALAGRSMLRAIRAAELLVFNDRLLIENLSIFKEAVVIPKQLIKVVSVDATKGDRRFPLSPEAAAFDLSEDVGSPMDAMLEDREETDESWTVMEVPSHLYTPQTSLLLPDVGEPSHVPNTLVLFTEPIFLRPLHLLPGYVVRGRFPSGDHPERGFWVRAQDPQQAAHLLSFIAPVRDLRVEDVIPLLPQLERAPAVRKRQMLVVALFVGLAIARLVGQFWPDDDTEETHVAGRDYCVVGENLVEEIAASPGGPSAPRGKVITRAITEITPPDGFVLAESGYGSLDDVASSRQGLAEEWRLRLDALNFLSAYSQIWERGSEALRVDVTEFEEYAAAVDYLSWELRYGCDVNEIFPLAGIEGGVGRESSDGADGRVLFTYAVRGGRTISVSHWNRSGDADREMATELTRRALTVAEAPRTPAR